MKLLIYSHFFLPSVGGVETVVLGLAKGLVQLPAQDGLSKPVVTLVTQNAAGSFDDGSLAFRVVRQPGSSELWHLIRDSDVVHLAGPSIAPLILALLARKPVVVEHHGFQTICPNGQLLLEPIEKPCPGHFMARHHRECLRCNAGQGWTASYKLWLKTFVRRLLCARASANITPTRWLGGLVELPRNTVIPHGLPSRMALSRTAYTLDPPLVVFQGRLVTTKGVRLLLEAARILDQQKYSFRVLIVGEGSQRNALEELVRDSGLTSRVQFAGQLAPAHLEAALAKASVVVAPSIGGEVFGLVVAESMQRGLPVIASDLGAFVEVLGEGGLLFRTGEAADLARKLVYLFDHPEIATELSTVAPRRIVQFFSEERMLEDHLRLYDSLLRSIPC
jgi:glycosyltransferase involved in cell wall biosynthesis